MDSNVPVRIVIEGIVDGIFLSGLWDDLAAVSRPFTSVTFEVGQAARVPLIREVN